MSDMHSSDAETYSSTGQMIFVPREHAAYIYPVAIANSTDDDGAAIIHQAIALHHVTDSLDNNELTPTGYDSHGAPLYAHQLEQEDG